MRYNPDAINFPEAERSWTYVSTLQPAPHGFEGGAVLVGSVEMINMQHTSPTYLGSFWNPLTDAELWEDDHAMDPASNSVHEPANSDKYQRTAADPVGRDFSWSYLNG